MQLIWLAKKINEGKLLIETENNPIQDLLQRAAEKTGFEIEIGCGNGHFLISYVKKNIHIFFAGIDFKKQRCLKVMKKIEKTGIKHARIIYGNASDLICNLPDNVVDLYHIYYPDPWPKARHKKRRFFRWCNLQELHRSLKPGGKIYFTSDIFDYYLQAKALLILHPGMELLVKQPPEEVSFSLFASKFAELEKSTYFVAGIKF